jgi:ParB-like chromosome segregation protein Spo0J
MEFHPDAAPYPLLTGKDFEDFKADIAAHGLLEPIVVLDGKILDGRNRYRAILEIEDEAVQPEFEEYTGDQTPEEYARSKNLYRRHLTASQRAMNAARARPAFETAASEQKKQAGQVAGRKGGRGHKKGCASKDAHPLSPRKAGGRGRASREVGKLAKVSPASVDRARIVLEHGTEDLVAMVDKGEVSVAAAATVAGHRPKGVQQTLAKEGAKAIQDAATKIKKRAKPRKNRSALELIETLKKDIDRLIPLVESADKGVTGQREDAVTNLRLAKKWIATCSRFFT